MGPRNKVQTYLQPLGLVGSIKGTRLRAGVWARSADDSLASANEALPTLNAEVREQLGFVLSSTRTSPWERRK